MCAFFVSTPAIKFWDVFSSPCAKRGKFDTDLSGVQQKLQIGKVGELCSQPRPTWSCYGLFLLTPDDPV